jgi:hypothetical protein
MLQRIQTIWVLLAALLTGLVFNFPLADISSGGEIYQFNLSGIYRGTEKIFNGLPLILFTALILLLHIYVIFLFKNRIRQMRILGFSIMLLLGLTGLFFYFAYAGFKGATVSFKIPVAFPVIAAIIDYLAIRAIGKDEALIRSVNRLRP